jgi:hypothetical protein
MEPPLPAEEVATETRKLLEAQGWCPWRCSALDNDVIIVVIDELVGGYPMGYPVYTVQELDVITVLDDQLLRVTYKAKKELGARIEAPGIRIC